MARPPKIKDPKKLNLYLPGALVAKARKLAKVANCSVSELFAEWLKNFQPPKP